MIPASYFIKLVIDSYKSQKADILDLELATATLIRNTRNIEARVAHFIGSAYMQCYPNSNFDNTQLGQQNLYALRCLSADVLHLEELGQVNAINREHIDDLHSEYKQLKSQLSRYDQFLDRFGPRVVSSMGQSDIAMDYANRTFCLESIFNIWRSVNRTNKIGRAIYIEILRETKIQTVTKFRHARRIRAIQDKANLLKNNLDQVTERSNEVLPHFNMRGDLEYRIKITGVA